MSASHGTKKKVDYLKEDKEISSQKFVCLSFLSPEDVIAKKEAYFVGKFVESLARGGRELFFKLLSEKHTLTCEEVEKEYGSIYDEVYNLRPENAQELYKDFLYRYEEDMTEKFNKENGNAPSRRGIKVRGSYSTQEEASERARHLIKRDPSHHVYVGEVGKWMPWLSNPDQVKQQEHANEELNEIMKAVMKKKEESDEFFEKNREAVLQNNRTRKDGKVVEPETFSRVPVTGVVDTLIKPEFKVVSQSVTDVTPDVEPCEGSICEASVAPPEAPESADGEAASGSIFSQESGDKGDLAEELAHDDPWVQRHLRKRK
jgi:flagellar motility protein MotE (MotC chaperone)